MVLNSLYQETILKPKQVICLESAYLERDVMCVLPTGYGKSLIFHLLPMLLFAKLKWRGNLLSQWKSKGLCTATVDSIVIVVSPLNSLMTNQISRLGLSGIRASAINVKQASSTTTIDETADADDIRDDIGLVDIDFLLCEKEKLRDGYYHIVFAHPETLISSKYGRDLLLSDKYTDNVVVIVIDEAHCILDWYVYFILPYILLFHDIYVSLNTCYLKKISQNL